MSVIDVESVPALPANTLTSEAKLLISEAKETCRSENQTPIRRWTGERLARERPRLNRLVLAMLAEGVSFRAIRRATLVDTRTIRSVERAAALSMPALKRELAGTTARVAKRTIERIEEEIEILPPNLLGMVFGIAIDKLQILTGDPTMTIQHNVTVSGNIFDRINGLAKTIQATVISPQLTEGSP